MGIWDRLFGRRGPKPQEIDEARRRAESFTPGQRGTPLGTEKTPGPGLTGNQVDGFVYGGEPLFVRSSNVAMVQYHFAARELMVEFLGGGAYLYAGVTEDEALSFARAGSKGGWIWSNLRIRGTKNGHRKPYRRIR